ncbi:MAG TPA: sigma-70 family RNA polymerase sigma factor [Candidatus Anaerostipes avistercoris]|uniref:Sigma-70 family RNA polymerase sigma factor n=2 Tax=Lachnospiraceae TaxID=186803 RepID=A0A9D2JTB0_9FIRM|nr:sigma-70 family RNA polymerase sigma factor [Candidatus Blautia pullicola]HJC50798.1 sigma-70 family RNA polymerase sigma factor [Candidatus Anaerostipes avistercoris]
MRGKRPKERRCYVLRTSDGIVVEVTREVYLEWYQSRRRERYQTERNRKYSVTSLEVMQENGNILKSDSVDLEARILQKLCMEKLWAAIDELQGADAYLLYLLFFEERTVKEVAQLYGLSRKTISNRRKRILAELKEKLKEMGITEQYF